MMNGDAENRIVLQELCTRQPLAVLATDAGTGPYVNLVAFAATPDHRQLYFITARSTRKWSNLEGNKEVALLIDNRDNTTADFSQAAAATVLGTAEELHGKEKEDALALYLKKHPYLEEFACAPTCALVRVQVNTIYLVTRFQNVVEYHFPS
jgi:nitroimidazol reductase NimA-like FMN-containing flavoprotein (pyridoxamine 5'-phosphate oxidase superfamily)